MLNCREINAVLAEFQLDGAWLKKVRQPDYRGIILEFSSPVRFVLVHGRLSSANPH